MLVDSNVVDVSTLHNKNLTAVLMPRFFGHPPMRRGEADTGSSMHFVTEYAFDVFGRVTRWELYSNAVRTVQLQIWRPVPETGEFRYALMGQVIASINEVQNNIALQAHEEIHVSPGDVIGWFMEGVQSIPFDTVDDCPNSTVRRVYGTAGQITNLDVSAHPRGWSRQYSVRAFVRSGDS